MDYKFTLYLGLNDKETKSQKIATVEAYKIVENLLKADFDGATIFEATGLYKHENGTFVTEKSLRIEILFAQDSQIRELVSNLKKMFNQESIAVEKSVITSELW